MPRGFAAGAAHPRSAAYVAPPATAEEVEVDDGERDSLLGSEDEDDLEHADAESPQGTARAGGRSGHAKGPVAIGSTGTRRPHTPRAHFWSFSDVPARPRFGSAPRSTACSVQESAMRVRMQS